MHLFLIEAQKSSKGYIYASSCLQEKGGKQEEELVQDINDKRNFKGRRMSGILSVASRTQIRPRW